jgi:serine/threonine-protein kinase
MSPNAARPPDDESVVFDALDRWQCRRQAGGDPSPEELAPARPDLWDRLRSDIGRLRRVPLPDTATDHPTLPLWPDIPGYRVTGELGRGGMGVVLAARERRLGRDVAIKLPLARGAMSRVALARFEREAEVTARLDHPGVPPVYTVGELADGRPFMVMRRIVGRTLVGFWDDLRRLDSGVLHHTEGRFFQFVDFVDVVAHAHRRGVVHRDLKPANFMAGEYGEKLVMDWGLARHLAPPAGRRAAADDDALWLPMAAAESVSVTGDLTRGALGTPRYMAPEQARGRLSGTRSDVFAIGAIMAEVMTGQGVYPGGTAAQVIAAAAAGQYNPGLRPALRALRHPWRAVVARCLDRNPDARPADAGELADLLRETV